MYVQIDEKVWVTDPQVQIDHFWLKKSRAVSCETADCITNASAHVVVRGPFVRICSEATYACFPSGERPGDQGNTLHEIIVWRGDYIFDCMGYTAERRGSVLPARGTFGLSRAPNPILDIIQGCALATGWNAHAHSWGAGHGWAGWRISPIGYTRRRLKDIDSTISRI